MKSNRIRTCDVSHDVMLPARYRYLNQLTHELWLALAQKFVKTKDSLDKICSLGKEVNWYFVFEIKLLHTQKNIPIKFVLVL